ncbi:hypothetical protein FGB62_17g342 [Gracilaria domingensis]|nr:hypothetical protein FGB62_17g342 [Gracilaria domingensis]
MRRNAQTDSGIWNALRRSMLLAASADSLSRAQMWGRLLDRNDPDNSTGPRDNLDENISPALEYLGRRSTQSASRNRNRDNRMMSDKAISMLYEIDDGFLWELGCWLGTQHLRTTDIFEILVEVLEKTSEVPGSPVEALCIQDNLFSYSTVRGGVRLLKELSGHLHENYDRTSNFFVHPMNDQRVQIIVSP